MANKQLIIFSIVSVVLLAGIFFISVFNELINLGAGLELSQVTPSEEDIDINEGGDPLITPASAVYASFVRETDPLRGDPSAPLLIMEFGDFECPYCADMYENLIKILADYRGQVKLIWKDFPNPSHLNARSAALAARCAGNEGKFWEYHDYLFANQGSLSRELYNQISLELNLDLRTFNSCLDSQEKIVEVGQGLNDGQKLGVDVTPYLFIGNSKFDYALSYDELKQAVERELR